MRRRHRTPAPANYAWLFDLLLARTATVTWAAAGELPTGFERAEQFAVLPAGAGRSFMVSLAARPGTSSALTSFNTLRPLRRRLPRSVLGLGLRMGLAQPLLRNKIDVGVAHDGTQQQRTGALLSEHLCQLLGRRPVVTAFGGGSGPYRKPVLQVFATDGTPLGYVKIGWNDWTRDAVCREADALRTCAARTMQLGVPAMLHQSVWRGLDLLVTAPLPPAVRRLGLSSRLPAVDLLREISNLSEPCVCEFAASPWWASLRGRIRTGVADPSSRTRLTRVAGDLEHTRGHARLQFGTWHGDFVPWNLARLGRRLYAWDWESSAPSAPVGFDALHFHFQVAFVGRRCSVAEAVVLAERNARPALGALGVTPDLHCVAATLHLLELAVRHEEARSSTGDIDDRFYPAALALLEAAADRPAGVTGLNSAGRPA